MPHRFLDPHYLLNGALLASYALLRLHFLQAAEEGRRLPGHFIANTRDLENWEKQALMAAAAVSLYKYWRRRSLDDYLGQLIFYGKLLLAMMAFNIDRTLFVVYVLVMWALCGACPQPMLNLRDVPELVAMTPTRLKEALRENVAGGPKGAALYVYCFTEQHAGSTAMAPVVAKLASRYSSEAQAWGCLDVATWKLSAKELGFGSSPQWGNQLPCVIKFQGGKEVARCPTSAVSENHFKINSWTLREAERVLGLGAAGAAAAAAAAQKGESSKKAR